MPFLLLLLLQSPPQLPPAPQPIDLEWALALPLSPGAVALLAENPAEPRSIERLSQSLAHDNPRVRAAAARVLYVSGTKTLLSEAEALLATETDRSAAGELMWVVAAQGGVSKGGLVVDAAMRLGMAEHAGTVLATTHQHLALRHLATLRADSGFLLSPFLALAARVDFSSLGGHTVVALREQDEEYWAAYLWSARETGSTLDEGHLAFGLRTSNDAMRFESIWHLIVELSPDVEVSPVVRDARSTLLVQRDSVEDVSEAFLLELLARAQGSTARESVASLAALDAKDPALLLTLARGYALVLLTESELRVLSQLLGGHESAFEGRAKNYRENPAASTGRRAAPSRTKPVLTTVGGFPRGLVSNLIKVTKCEPRKDGGLMLADISYSLDGRRLATAFQPTPDAPSGGCAQTSRALVLLNLHRADPRSGQAAGWDRLVVLNTPAFLSCLESDGSDQSVRRVGRVKTSRIRQPNKTKDVPPNYPNSAKTDGVQGTVILDAIVTRDGCVQNIRTLRSVDDRLDFAAVYSLMQWEYEPALLDGAAVPIVMDVTISFALSYGKSR